MKLRLRGFEGLRHSVASPFACRLARAIFGLSELIRGVKAGNRIFAPNRSRKERHREV